MTDKTFHVFRAADGAWAVQRAGTKPVGFRTRVEALKSARSKARKRNQAQVVVHLDDGTFAVDYMKGLPAVQAPPQKSTIGTAAISRAISGSVLKRLGSA